MIVARTDLPLIFLTKSGEYRAHRPRMIILALLDAALAIGTQQRCVVICSSMPRRVDGLLQDADGGF